MSSFIAAFLLCFLPALSWAQANYDYYPCSKEIQFKPAFFNLPASAKHGITTNEVIVVDSVTQYLKVNANNMMVCWRHFADDEDAPFSSMDFVVHVKNNQPVKYFNLEFFAPQCKTFCFEKFTSEGFYFAAVEQKKDSSYYFLHKKNLEGDYLWGIKTAALANRKTTCGAAVPHIATSSKEYVYVLARENYNVLKFAAKDGKLLDSIQLWGDLCDKTIQNFWVTNDESIYIIADSLLCENGIKNSVFKIAGKTGTNYQGKAKTWEYQLQDILPDVQVACRYFAYHNATIDTDGNLFLVIFAHPDNLQTDPNAQPVHVLKINQVGDILWKKSYGTFLPSDEYGKPAISGIHDLHNGTEVQGNRLIIKTASIKPLHELLNDNAATRGLPKIPRICDCWVSLRFTIDAQNGNLISIDYTF